MILNKRPLPTRPHLWSALALTLCLGLATSATKAEAAYSPSKTPAKKVPVERGGGVIQPEAIMGDDTRYNDALGDPKKDNQFWFAVDVETSDQGTFLFTATGQGIQVFKISDNPADPRFVGYGFAPEALPGWQHSDKDLYFKDIDAPPGVTNEVATSGEDQGVVIWNTSANDNPTVHYQDGGVFANEIYATTLGGVRYAFALGQDGVYLYNMSAAQSMTKCLDTTPTQVACPGVYKGKLNSIPNGLHMSGTGNFLTISRSRNGFQIWNVANPTSPVLVMDSAIPARNVGMWQAGNSIYIAVLDGGFIRTYNVSCILSGSCALTAALGQIAVPVPTGVFLEQLTISFNNNRPIAYAGADFFGLACAPQMEYLIDLSTPNALQDIMPAGSNYWGWYYESCSTGFNWVAPRVGKFQGDYFYRAAMGILDVHRLTGVGQPPSVDFSTSPAEIYPGTPVSFQDLSTGNPNQWAWTFEGGAPSSSSLQNPTAVTFASPGSKAVSLTAQNANGPASRNKTVTVLDPAPRLTSISIVPANPVVCQPVTFTANGAGGQPPLTWSWQVDNGAPVATGSTPTSFVWNTGSTTQAGSYTATLTLSNQLPGVAKTLQFTLSPLGTLPADASFTPTAGSPNGGTVQFHAGEISGATAWSWDFDDDANPATDAWGPWITDTVAGKDPLHSYTTVGLRKVRVRVKNCVNENGVVSALLSVNVDQITPLIASFSLKCAFGFCGGNTFTVGTNILFQDGSSGATAWEYDWNGDGTYEESLNAPAPSHAYSTTGTYRPKLRVKRGTEVSAPFTLATDLIITPGTPPPSPSISISGPSSGQSGQALSFTASASNCTPSAAGWSWTANGGTITGSPNASVTISWPSDGTKSISVTNSACSGATGSKTVTIGTVTPPPSQLQAVYTYSPLTPNAGQAVSFDGSASTGSPQNYVWDFGDGTPFGTGAKVAHSFAKAGTYKVALSVSKPGNCPPAPFCENVAQKTVIVGDGLPPLIASFDTSATCINEFGLNVCKADTGTAVSFTSTTTGNPTSYSWSFGDGGTASGSQVTHTWTTPGPFTVRLTVGDGRSTSTAERTFNLTGPPVNGKKSVILPWIAQSRGALVQSSDLYLLNPSTSAMNVTLTFLQRGTPETNPPKVTKVIQPGATLYAADVLRQMFNRENITGFVTIAVDQGSVEPIITSYNTTVQANGSEFGQTIPGFSMSTSGGQAGSPGSAQLQNLVGLNANSEFLAYFGLSNPTLSTVNFNLRFVDNQGRQIGSTYDYAIAPLGHRQFLPKDVQNLFGISGQDDYRVEIRTTGTGQLYPFGANIRTGSADPSFIGVGSSTTQKVYLLGALSTGGINKSVWQSDVVLTNTANEVVLTDVTFTAAGAASQPTQPLHLTLHAGETQRLEDVIGRQWGIRNTVGVVTLDSNAPGGLFPIAQGESYENTNPTKRFGQTLPAMTEAQAAGSGQAQYLTGLRQDAKNRTTLWIFNPSSQFSSYDVVYLALDGHELGRINDVVLPAGRLQQLSPLQHKLPGNVAADGFTVQVRVKSGKILAAAQVVKNATNDPAYIQGATR